MAQSLTLSMRFEMPVASTTAVAMVVPLALSTIARTQIGS